MLGIAARAVPQSVAPPRQPARVAAARYASCCARAARGRPVSDLQLALLAVAGVVLALLYAYNKWQERRALRELEANLRRGVGDPLLQPMKAAPHTEADAAAMAPTPAVEITDLPLAALYGGRIEPRLGAIDSQSGAGVDEPPVRSEGADESPQRAAGAARWVEDPMLDWALELRCAHAVDGVAVFDAAAPLARLESALPAFLVAWDARSQQWVAPDRFGFYSELLVAMQLAHRRHRLDEIGASRFLATVQQVALALDADFDAPEVAQVVELAARLDRLCARFDVQIGMTLQAANGAWDAATVAQAARAAGLVAAGERWEFVSESGAALFVLRAPASPTDRLALELDVPLAPAAEQPLRVLFRTAETLAASLGARVIDDNGRPVSAASLAGVAEQLETLYAEMRAAGIEPGGVRARRLYG